MRVTKLLAVGLLVVVLSGCPGGGGPAGDYVTRQEFDEYKARIKANGTALELWVDSAHAYLHWLDKDGKLDAIICPDCEPVNPPPSPPPDGEWE